MCTRTLALCFALFLTAIESPLGAEPKREPRVEVAAAVVETQAPTPVAEPSPPVVSYDGFHGFGIANCAYLAPKGDFIGEDGGVDVVAHFHAGQMSEREMRESGLSGVFIACGYGIGGAPYAAAYANPRYFGVVVSRLLATLAKSAGRPSLHLRKLALASWSAGFVAIAKILQVPRWYEATDTVVLLDSIHAPYAARPGQSKAVKQGSSRDVDTRSIGIFIRYARDAAAGKKAMIVTHSSIIPPDYASSGETASALLDAIGVPSLAEPAGAQGMRGMTLTRQADEGNLHVRGFRGRGKTDHFDHLHLIGEVLKSWLVPRWSDARLYSAQ